MRHQVFSNLEPAAGLVLADGSTWSIVGRDEVASTIVSRLREAMQLGPHNGAASRLLVVVDRRRASLMAGDRLTHIVATGELVGAPNGSSDLTLGGSFLPSCTVSPSKGKEAVICVVDPAENLDMLALQLMRLSLVIGWDAQIRGGLLLHGALVERKGDGVLLAGPGGVGKTTASKRFPPPWRSLCDDTTLVVLDEQGEYRAHPWPTWSKFMFGGPGGTWDVQHSVPLRCIFFLAQAPEDQITSVDVVEAVCLMVNFAEQACGQISRRMKKDEVRTLRLQRFDNICSLAQAVPCYRLRLGLDGLFWKEMERVVDRRSKGIP